MLKVAEKEEYFEKVEAVSKPTLIASLLHFRRNSFVLGNEKTKQNMKHENYIQNRHFLDHL